MGRHAPTIKPMLLASDRDFMGLLRSSSRGAQRLARNEDPFGDYHVWEQLDASLQPPVTRLFLYSAKDQLFPPDLIEAYIRHTAEYNSQASVFKEKCERSAHCKLWATEQERCAKAVTEMLRYAGVLA